MEAGAGDLSPPLLEEIVQYLAQQVGIEADPRVELQPATTRDIVVLSGPLDDAIERAVLSWAVMTGAAVVLEPTQGHRVATAAWVRPTVFYGTAEEIAQLRLEVEKERPRWWRRLRAVLVKGAEALPDSEAAFWRPRWVEIGRI